jgi:hypothetical protein
MRRAFNGLLRDFDVMTIAFAIPIGWALYQVAHGVSQLVAAAVTDYPPGLLSSSSGLTYFGPLAWSVGGRVLNLGPIVFELIELAVVLSIAAFVHARFSDRPATNSAPPE